MANSPRLDKDESDDEFYESREFRKKRSRAASLIHDVASLPKRVAIRLDLAPSHDTQMDADGRSVPGITDNPAFNPSLVFPQQRSGVHTTVNKTVNAVHKAGSAIAHPKAAVRMAAAAKVPIDETPYLTEEADMELLMAQEELLDAEASAEESDTHMASAMASDAENLRDIRTRRVNELEEQRSAMRAAWVTSKHVNRVRVVPRRHIPWPKRSEYYEFDEASRKTLFKWHGYLGHMLLYISQDYTTQYVDDCHNEVPFNRNVLLDHVQRLLIATAPWQAWLMDVRKISRWEDPWLTGKWFCIYLVLIKTGYIMTFFYGYVIYITLRSRYTSHTERIQTLRDAYTRAHDQHSRVAKLTELIRRHGNDQWLEPLLEELGPVIQMQVNDAADFCEMLQNFYHWANPRMTACALMFWVSCCLTSAFTSVEYATRIFWYVGGFWFFWSRPLASRYPEYRKVVSLFRWIYWGIPTHSELAMSQLRNEAVAVRTQLIEDHRQGHNHTAANPATSVPNGSPKMPQPARQQKSQAPHTQEQPDLPILTFRGTCKSKSGRLVVTTQGMHFVRSSVTPSTIYSSPSTAPLHSLTHTNTNSHNANDKNEDMRATNKSKDFVNAERHILWKRTWSELYEMRKINTPRKLSTTLATSLNSSIPHPLQSSLHEKLNKLRTSVSPETKSETDPESGTEKIKQANQESTTEKVKQATESETKKTKHSPSKSPSIGTTKALALIFTPGETMIIESMRKRDEAFNLIIGMSGIQFQVLQPLELNLKGSSLNDSNGNKKPNGAGLSAEEQVRADMPRVNVVPVSLGNGTVDSHDHQGDVRDHREQYTANYKHRIRDGYENDLDDASTNTHNIDSHTNGTIDTDTKDKDDELDKNQILEMGNTKVRTEEAREWLLPKIGVLATRP